MTALRTLIVCAAAVSCVYAAPPEPISFEKQIKPILEARCLKCHGQAMQLGKLDLRSRELALKGGDKGPAFTPGKPDVSILYRRVAGVEKPAMPMDGKLSAEEVETIRSWIGEGAEWPDGMLNAAAVTKPKGSEDAQLPPGARDYWAFRKPVKAPVPEVSDSRWSKNPIDAFVKQQLDSHGLKPAPEADKQTLVRRAFLDLTGLPPSPGDVKAFVNDSRPDAWQRLVDRLLASPHYGERWGRHWLDVARYADSNGYEHDFDRPNAWRYRDYVIHAYNNDTPYDRFLTEQLAGDEVSDVSYETLIATGFLRNYAKVGFREKDNPQFRYDYLDDMIATIGRGVLGLTVHCARCHDHKFDPILQKDYYRLEASLFGYVEVDHPLVPKAEADAYKRKVEEINAAEKVLREEIDQIEEPYRKVLLSERYKRYPANIQEAIRTPEDQRTPGQVLLANQVIRTTKVSSAQVDRLLKPEERERKRELLSKVDAIESQRPAPIPVAMGITDGDYRFTPDGAGDEPAPGKGVKQEVTEGSFLHEGPDPYQVPPSYLLISGDMHNHGALMKPGFITVLTTGNPPVELPPASGNTSGRRLALAKWLTSPDHPLTSRVMANRIWHHHFGRGIVPTLDNFGRNGDKPTNQELLDWLAVEFRERGWSIKAMHRLIMNSETYRMASSFADADDLAKDRDNQYLWRFRQQRLEAEIVRDSILAVSGSLNAQMDGPPVFPKLQAEVLESMKNGIWRDQEEGPETWRRSVYVYRKRGLPFPFFEVFDLPDQTITCGRRNISTVPTQALTLLNNQFVLEQSKLFAALLKRQAGDDAAAQVDLAWQLALGRLPREEERRLGVSFVEKNATDDLAHVLFNLSEFLYLR